MALALGIPVRELQARMPHAEWVEWQAFMATEPIDSERLDFAVAMLLYQQAAIHGEKGKQPKLTDLMPNFWKQDAPVAAPRSLADKFRALTTHT